MPFLHDLSAPPPGCFEWFVAAVLVSRFLPTIERLGREWLRRRFPVPKDEG